jgi:hypothetical protein
MAAVLGLASGLWLVAGCGDDDPAPATPEPPVVSNTGTCVSCHQDADILQAVASPEPPLPGDAGEG